MIWAAQAASLPVSAACRDASISVSALSDVAGKLPATAGWQPALPGTRSVTYTHVPTNSGFGGA